MPTSGPKSILGLIAGFARRRMRRGWMGAVLIADHRIVRAREVSRDIGRSSLVADVVAPHLFT